jgi:adenylate cyclase
MYQKIITIILFIGLLVWNPYPFQILDLKTYDWLIMNTEPVQNENILIVDIDEETVNTYGGWPLPRSVYGDAIMQTQAIPGITVLMPNKDLRGAMQDEYFRRRLEVKPTVLAYAASTQVRNTQAPHVGTAQLGEDPLPWLYEYPGIIPTEPTLESKIKGIGLVTATPEVDGVTRRIPLVVNVGSKLYPSFALELLRVGVGDPSYQLKTTNEGVSWVRIPSYPLMNTDANGRIFLNWNTNFL